MGGEMEQRMVVALERIAVANEKLIDLAEEEREVLDQPIMLPFCPHCGKINPEVRSEGGDGEMSEFVLVARCGSCAGTLFALPTGWQIYKTGEDARANMEGRNET